MIKFESYLKDIHHYFPGLNIFSIQETGEGDNSRAFEINDKYIFRFPKREDVKNQLKKETDVLPKIRKHLSLAIPDFKFISPTLSFAAHSKISGIPLSFKRFYSLEKTRQVNIQHSLSDFLTQLHGISLAGLQNCGLEVMDMKEEYSANFFNTKQFIYPNISDVKRTLISHLFSAYLDDPTNFNYQPALIHNDLSKDHILFDLLTGRLCGIIDFGDMAIGDPDYDYMYLYDEFGEDFLQRILSKKRSLKPNIINKLSFFILGNRLQILLKAIEDNNDADIKDGYRQLNALLKKQERNRSQLKFPC
ncbi:MAG: phosphotransferase [Ginsengibacter sp.]